MLLARLKFTGLAVLALAVVSSLAYAQQRAPWPSERFNPQAQRNVAGEFDYYALVLSWSPTYCSSPAASGRDDSQCNRGDGRRFSFILHGLWPQYEKGYPNSCRTARRPYVPQPLIDKMLDIMPSSGLIVHEYRKHGTCSGLDPDAYFSTARRLFESVRVPELFKNPFEAQFLSPGDVARAFIRANPSLKSESIAISCGGAGNRLREVRFCFSKDGNQRACGENENQRRMCSADRMYVPPVRSTSRDDGTASRPNPPRGSGQSPLPGPRLIENPNDI